jgi:hypothetical protein
MIGHETQIAEFVHFHVESYKGDFFLCLFIFIVFSHPLLHLGEWGTKNLMCLSGLGRDYSVNLHKVSNVVTYL